MQPIYASDTASITELKRNPSQLISEARGRPVAILNHNSATAYLVPAETFNKIVEALDNQYLEALVHTRLNDNKKPIKVDLDEL